MFETEVKVNVKRGIFSKRQMSFAVSWSSKLAGNLIFLISKRNMLV